jgi:hypothetical protein
VLGIVSIDDMLIDVAAVLPLIHRHRHHYVHLWLALQPQKRPYQIFITFFKLLLLLLLPGIVRSQHDQHDIGRRFESPGVLERFHVGLALGAVSDGVTFEPEVYDFVVSRVVD